MINISKKFRVFDVLQNSKILVLIFLLFSCNNYESKNITNSGYDNLKNPKKGNVNSEKDDEKTNEDKKNFSSIYN